MFFKSKSISKMVLFLFSISGIANAGLNVDLRLDDNSVSYNTVAKDSGAKDHYNWYFKTLRADYTSKINDSMSAKLRINFNKNVTMTTGTLSALAKSPDALNSQSDIIELAYFKHMLSEGLSLTLGKFATDVAGWENQSSSPDRYVDSLYLDTTTKSLKYLAGAMLSYKIGDQNIDLQITNNPTVNSATDISAANQNRGVIGVVYKGQFMDKTLKPILSYHTYSPQFGTDPKANYTYATIGLRYESDTFLIDLDDNMAALKGRTAADKTDLSSTVNFGFALKGNAFTPKIKFDSSKDTKVSASDVKTDKTYANAGLVLEYKPVLDTNVRYHAGITQLTSKPDGGSTSAEMNYIVGVRIAGDILK